MSGKFVTFDDLESGLKVGEYEYSCFSTSSPDNASKRLH